MCTNTNDKAYPHSFFTRSAKIAEIRSQDWKGTLNRKDSEKVENEELYLIGKHGFVDLNQDKFIF